MSNRTLVQELRDFDAAFRQMMQDLTRKLHVLEERLDRLEQSKAIAYRGSYAPDEQYAAGEYVSHNGLWCAIRETRAGDAPGRSASWRLAVKQ